MKILIPGKMVFILWQAPASLSKTWIKCYEIYHTKAEIYKYDKWNHVDSLLYWIYLACDHHEKHCLTTYAFKLKGTYILSVDFHGFS